MSSRLRSSWKPTVKRMKAPWYSGSIEDGEIIPSPLDLTRTFSTALTLTAMFLTSVQFSCSLSDSLWRHGLQHARLPGPSPTLGTFSNSCPLSRWCHPTISSSVVRFSSWLQSFPTSGSFPMSRFFASCGQSIWASALVLPMNIQDQFPLRLTDLISPQSKGLSRVFSNTTVQKYVSDIMLYKNY